MKFMKFIGAALGMALLAAGSTAQAGSITIGGGQIAGPDRFEDFNIGISIAGVTNEFAGNGLTFTTLSGAGISLIRNVNCGNSGGRRQRRVSLHGRRSGMLWKRHTGRCLDTI